MADIDEVTQVHLAMGDAANAMRVMWTTATDGAGSRVEYERADGSGQRQTALGSAEAYTAGDMCNAPANASVGFVPVGQLHTVALEALAPATLYRYRIATARGFTPWTSFVSPPPVGANVSVDVVLFGDMGVQTPYTHTEFWYNYGVRQQPAAPRSLRLVERYVAEGTPKFRTAGEF